MFLWTERTVEILKAIGVWIMKCCTIDIGRSGLLLFTTHGDAPLVQSFLVILSTFQTLE